MIVSQIILAVTALLTCCFTGVYLFRPAWRSGIEQPKYSLQRQLERIEHAQQAKNAGGDSHEP